MAVTYRQEVANKRGWSRWVTPVRLGYRMACCDCGLVHTFEFRMRKRKVQFRCRRNNRATAQIRKWETRKRK